MKVYKLYPYSFDDDPFIYIDNDDLPVEVITETLRKFFNNYWLKIHEIEYFDIPNLYEIA